MLAGLPQLSRTLVVGVGSLYAAGLLIVNIDLARYGLSNLDLARPEYVLAGALWAVVVGPTSLLATILLRRIITASWERQWTNAFRWLIPLALSGAVVPGTALAAAAAFGRLGLSHVERLKMVAELSGLSAVITGIAALAWILLTSALALPPVRRTAELRVVFSALAAVLAATILVTMLTLYSLVAFPRIPKHLGGGRKATVELGLSENTSGLMKRLGLPVSADGLWVGPVSLVLDTTTTVTVAMPSPDEGRLWRFRRQHAVTLDRKIIAAMLLTPSFGLEEGMKVGMSRSPSAYLPDTVDPRGPKK